MNEFEARYKTLRFIWGILLFMFAGVIATAIIGDGIGIFHFLIIGALLTMGMIATSEVSSSAKPSNAQSKSDKGKNDDKVRDILSRLSDTELENLRESLQDGEYNLSDDGELVRRR